MDWIKRNIGFVIGAVFALGLLGFGGYYIFSGWKHNADMWEKINTQYGELKQLKETQPNAGGGNIDNIKLAKDQQEQVRKLMADYSKFFQKISAIPEATSTNGVRGEEFTASLRRTIDQLTRDAANASVILPPKYNFSFETQAGKVRFAQGSLDPLAVQLGEIKVIADVLIAAKVNSLDGIRRERVSADDQTGADYIDLHSQTNEMAVTSPYEVTFRSFSPELAAVVSGFAASPYSIVVKAINVDSSGAATGTALGGAPTPSAGYVPPPVYTPPPPSYYGAARGGDAYRGAAPAYTPPAAVAPVKTGLQTVLNEKQIKVTMLVEVVKLLPKK